MSEPITRHQKFKEAERELALRRTVYAKKVREGKMRPQEAHDRIAVMEAIMDDYRDPIPGRADEQGGQLL